MVGLGYSAEIINFIPEKPGLLSTPTLNPIKLVKMLHHSALKPVKKYEGARLIGDLLGRILNYKYMKKRRQKFEEFRKYYLRISQPVIHDINELRHVCSKYDICIVGSDQVWNPLFLVRSNFAYLLPFSLKTRKVAFSASIAEDIPDELIGEYKQALSEFHFISLREKTTCDLVSPFIGRKINSTLDPTLLLCRESYEAIMNEEIPLPSGRYLLVYNLDESILPLAKRVSQLYGLQPVVFLKSMFSDLKPSQTFKFEGPREFVALLKNAEMLVTNSFHGSALSILFEKPFVVSIEGRFKKRQVRILDLLDLLGLKERLISPNTSIVEPLNKPINYDKVNEILEKLRRESLDMLRFALS